MEALIEDVNEGDVTCLRDNGEGIWIDNQRKKSMRYKSNKWSCGKQFSRWK